MVDLSTYRLSDFILFSQQTYYRLFELYNQAIWPWHVLPVCACLSLVYLYWKKPAWSGYVLAVILMVSWLWVAWAFLYQRFYQIHVAANWYALGFVLEAGFIFWFGIAKNRFRFHTDNSARKIIGFFLVTVAFFLYPFVPLLSGRSGWQFEMFALAPDPTVLATIGLLLLVRAGAWLYIVPVIWVIISSITLLVM